MDVLHQGRANVSKSELKERIAKLYKVQDPQTIQIFGFKTQFGGGRSTGFCLIYDNLQVTKKFEPKYRLVRVSVATIVVQNIYVLNYRLDLLPKFNNPESSERKERTEPSCLILCTQQVKSS